MRRGEQGIEWNQTSLAEPDTLQLRGSADHGLNAIYLDCDAAGL